MDAGFIGHDHGQDEVGVEGVLGQRAEPRALDEEAFRGTLTSGAVDAGVGGFSDPDERLGAQVREGGEGPAVEERVADEFDGRLHAALELRVADGRGAGLEEVVAGESQKRRLNCMVEPTWCRTTL